MVQMVHSAVAAEKFLQTQYPTPRFCLNDGGNKSIETEKQLKVPIRSMYCNWGNFQGGGGEGMALPHHATFTKNTRTTRIYKNNLH